MGIVVQATHLHLGQPVAMKFLLPEVVGNPQVVQRFLREAQAAVRLKSEHVARVLDVGVLEAGAPYMVLEYLEGADLASFPRSKLMVGGIVDLVLQACEALAEAHALGIVHRDIKPANLFITQRADGEPLLKVLDFGISKLSAMNGQLTATQTVVGTPAYMSPEQMRSSRDVDHRSDIWSLGVVLYELLQGAPPFSAETFSSLVLQVANDPLPQLTVRVPDGLDRVIYRCLEKAPERRFQSVAEFVHAVAKYARSEAQAAISRKRTQGVLGMDAHRVAPEPASAQWTLPSTITGAVGARTMPSRGNRRRSILGVVAGTVLIGGIVAWFAVRGGGSASSPPIRVAPPGERSMAAAAVPPATAADAMPTAVVYPPSADSAAVPTVSASPDAGAWDAASLSSAMDAAVSPPRRLNTAGKGPAQPNTGANHASQTRSATSPDVDRGD